MPSTIFEKNIAGRFLKLKIKIMPAKINHQAEELEKKVIARAKRRQSKAQPKMKVSGRSVFGLQRIIIKKKTRK